MEINCRRVEGIGVLMSDVEDDELETDPSSEGRHISNALARPLLRMSVEVIDSLPLHDVENVRW